MQTDHNCTYHEYKTIKYEKDGNDYQNHFKFKSKYTGSTTTMTNVPTKIR